MPRLAGFVCAVALAAALGGAAGFAQGGPGPAGPQDIPQDTPQDTRAEMERALHERDAARARAQRLEAAAAAAAGEAERTARQAAALAARIQQAEAAIALAQARHAAIAHQRRDLALRLALRQQPIVRLTAALQRFSRRPLAFTVVRPGSVREMVYLRALISSALPEVQARTAALRDEVRRGERLERAAAAALAALRIGEGELRTRRRELEALAVRREMASRAARAAASREAELALALGEQARDLDALLARLDAAGVLRGRLAALPGPIIRPPRPADSRVVLASPLPPAGEAPPPSPYQLPVAGRIEQGFGSPTAGGPSKGLTLVPREGAQIVAPAGGRVVFAGPYRGYGRIVIIEHAGGWTSLVTGLARIDVAVGDDLLGGAPLGIAPRRRPLVSIELRRGGEPVNPLEHLG